MPFTKQHSAYAWVVTCILFLINLTFHNLPLHSSYKIHQPITDYFLRLPYSELLEKRLFRSRANRRLVSLSYSINPAAAGLPSVPRIRSDSHSRDFVSKPTCTCIAEHLGACNYVLGFSVSQSSLLAETSLDSAMIDRASASLLQWKLLAKLWGNPMWNSWLGGSHSGKGFHGLLLLTSQALLPSALTTLRRVMRSKKPEASTCANVSVTGRCSTAVTWGNWIKKDMVKVLWFHRIGSYNGVQRLKDIKHVCRRRTLCIRDTWGRGTYIAADEFPRTCAPRTIIWPTNDFGSRWPLRWQDWLIFWIWSAWPQIVSRHVKFGDEGAIHLHGATQRTSLAEVFPCRAFQHSKSCQEVFHTTSTMGAGLAMIRDVIVKKKNFAMKNNIFDFPLHLHKVWNRRIVSQIGANVETNELDQFAGRDTKTCKNA